MPGTYTLLIHVQSQHSLEIGSLGTIDFPAGRYAYTGSAHGPGGFARVDRHRRTAAGENDTLHWHIDYLLHSGDVHLEDVFTAAGADRECEIAEELPGEPVDGFGASDCGCDSHLAFSGERDELAAALASVYPSSNSSEM
ncbi:MAG: DUF123 domain-containing protein [Candidatus Nanohaloarchaea archaeon]